MSDTSSQEWNHEEEIDFDTLEAPQLIRRNAEVHSQHVTCDFILEKNSEKIYEDTNCPICLSTNDLLYPLKCGHVFCQADIEQMINNSKDTFNLLTCPICRQYQFLHSFDEVKQIKQDIEEEFKQIKSEY